MGIWIAQRHDLERTHEVVGIYSKRQDAEAVLAKSGYTPCQNDDYWARDDDRHDVVIIQEFGTNQQRIARRWI